MSTQHNVKMIWDFRGPAGKKTAEHHIIHLKEFMLKEDRIYIEIGVNLISEFHAIAFLTIEENEVAVLREALKPHRGILAE